MEKYFLDERHTDKIIRFRLHRESSYVGITEKKVKDLSGLERDISRVIIFDYTPISYEFQ
jgi:TFIIF-interacting CTD phosphatase-like protein